MKKIIFLFILSYGYAYAQTPLTPYCFTITINKTSNIIFPFAIKGADAGSHDVLMQKAKGAENILELRAAKENFAPTSLSVVTADGKLFGFVVSYETNPKILNLSFGSLDTDASAMVAKTGFLLRKTSNMGMELSLRSIYIKDNLLWFVFMISNHSQIPFAPASIQCSVRDRSKATRTSMQQQELTPTYIQNTGMINGHTDRVFACAFDAFALPATKKMVLTIAEQQQQRILSLVIPAKTLLKARIFK